MPEDTRPGPASAIGAHVAPFVRTLTFDALPDAVVRQAPRCMIDLIGVAAAGTKTRLSAIARDYAEDHLSSRDHSVRMLFDGRRASTAGAGFAGAATIDSIDAHDGHALTKGHAGVAILPTLVAMADLRVEESAGID